MDMSKCERLKAKIEGLGGPDEQVAVALDEFLDGNDEDGSFAVNACQSIAKWVRQLRAIQTRPEVRGIYPVIVDLMEGEESWPYSDTALIYTSASADEAKNWFQQNLVPDELGELESDTGLPPGAPEPEPGTRVLVAWWD